MTTWLDLAWQVCLPRALPASRLSMANLWVGGHLMKNGLHFDNYDNLLHQLAGSEQGRTWCTPTPCTFPSVHC